jgi:hypothetical protein
MDGVFRCLRSTLLVLRLSLRCGFDGPLLLELDADVIGYRILGSWIYCDAGYEGIAPVLRAEYRGVSSHRPNATGSIDFTC